LGPASQSRIQQDELLCRNLRKSWVFGIHSIFVPKVALEPRRGTLVELHLPRKASGAFRVQTVGAAFLRKTVDGVCIDVTFAKKVAALALCHIRNLHPPQWLR
jgi:hypothetical protein